MERSEPLRYIRSDQVVAGGVALQGLPLASADRERPIGELDGLVIDLAERRVRYLVVKDATTRGKHLLPLDATSLNQAEQALERVSSDDEHTWEPFDPGAFKTYDDEAMRALLFGPTAA